MSNSEKIAELRPEVRWAGYRLLEECERMGFKLRITEGFRTQERQNALYEQGRSKPGSIVTWTLKSYHTLRLAIDLYPENCTHQQIEKVALQYGITHPFPSDPPHYEFNQVSLPEPTFTPSIDAKIKAVTRGIERASGEAKIMLTRQLDRLLDRVRRRKVSA